MRTYHNIATVAALILHAVSQAVTDIGIRFDHYRLFELGGALECYSDELYWRHNDRSLTDWAVNG